MKKTKNAAENMAKATMSVGVIVPAEMSSVNTLAPMQKAMAS